MFIDGEFTFFLMAGDSYEKVPVADLVLERTADNSLAIVHNGVSYEIDFHSGVECLMARFIERGGKLLYSEPPIEDAAELADMGMVLLTQYKPRFGGRAYVAREFGEPGSVHFWPLLWKMDFFREQIVWVSDSAARPNTPSADDFDGLFERYAVELKSEVGSFSFNRKVGSYFNVMESDLLKAYLMPGEASLKMSSTPLRIHWSQDSFGTKISRIGILSFGSLVDKPLWESSDGDDAVGQLDVLTMYNFASILKSFQMEDPAHFADIRAMLCQ